MGSPRVSARGVRGGEAPRTDQDLEDVARVLAGDIDAFAGIVSRWQGRLLNLAWRFCRDRADAEDMAQEAFVRAFRALPTFRGESAFSTWLTSIALNAYRSALRDRPAPAPPVPLVDVQLPAGASADALSLMMGEERDTTVRRMVLTLPAKYRDALVVFYFEERDLVETARVLRVAEGTLKARLHRGRELLRRRLLNVQCSVFNVQCSVPDRTRDEQ